MVLRALTAMALLLPCLALGQQNANVQAYERAKQLNARGETKQSLQVLEQAFGIGTNPAKAPKTVLELAAKNFEKERSFKSAITFTLLMAQKEFPAVHPEVIAAYKARGNADALPDVPEALGKHYFQLARLYTKSTLATGYLTSREELEQARAQAKMYLDIADELDVGTAQVERMSAVIAEEELREARMVMARHWTMSLAYKTWQDEITLVTPTAEEPLVGTTEAWCLSLGKRWENAYGGFSWDGQLCSGKANVGENLPSLDYFQKGVAVSALFFGPTVYGKPTLEHTSIGLALPLMYRKGDYQAPEGLQLEDTTRLSIGAMADARWKSEKFGLGLQFGKMLGLPSVMWQLGVNYDF